MEWSTSSAATNTGNIQTLIELTLDSAMGFRHAAEQVENPVIAHAFRVNANTRELFVRQLQAVARAGGALPRLEGTPTAMLHRWWLGVRGSLGSAHDHTILSEVQFDEEAVEACYTSALGEPLEPALRTLLAEQHESVHRALARIRAFRDESAGL